MESFTLGRYSVLEELGRGGMGVVYRARDERLQRQVALKVLPAGLREDERSRTRLRREALAAAILNHPNIVSVLDFDESGGSCFIAYEYVEGKTLDRVLDQSGIGEAKAAAIGRQLAEAIAYSHERGILHRDIKPQNIMLTPEGRAKLLDFGLARPGTAAIAAPDGRILDCNASITAAGTIVGTAAYMSPEQLTGETLDGRTDIFSLGAVLYEMLVGENPFRAPSFAGTVASIMAPDPPAIPGKVLSRSPGLSAIVNRCLQKPRDKRYPGARILADDLAALAEPGAKSFPAIPPARRTDESGLIPRGLARSLLSLVQFLYLAIYGVAIYKSGDVLAGVHNLAAMIPVGFLNHPFEIASGLLITGCCGIPVRLYLLASIAFHDPDLRDNFRKLFPLLFVLDEVWALSPFLLAGKWPAGVTLICVALLAYLPITQRNLAHDACTDIQARNV